jgi:hypothetical protein
MSFISEILKTYSIPYDKQLNKKMASVYMTPNAVIMSHSFLAVSRGSGFYRMVDKINSIDNHIYLYLDKITTEDEYHRFITELSTKIDIQKINIITNINDILNIPGIMDYSFGIHHCGALWSLTMVDMHKMIIGRSIIVPSIVYNRAIAIMEDYEIERLHTYNIIVSDDYYPNLVYIIQDTHNNKEPFTTVIRFTPLDGGQRSAIRVIDGMTVQCEYCHKIVYMDKKHQHKCVDV